MYWKRPCWSQNSCVLVQETDLFCHSVVMADAQSQGCLTETCSSMVVPSWTKSSPVPGLSSWLLWLGILSVGETYPWSKPPQCCPVSQLLHWPSIGCSLCFVLPKGPCQCWSRGGSPFPVPSFAPGFSSGLSLLWLCTSFLLHCEKVALVYIFFHKFPLLQALHLPGNISGEKGGRAEALGLVYQVSGIS